MLRAESDRCELKQHIKLEKETKFSFWYYMNGRQIGTFELKAVDDKVVWSKTGGQGAEWLKADVSLPVGDYEVNILFNHF